MAITRNTSPKGKMKEVVDFGCAKAIGLGQSDESLKSGALAFTGTAEKTAKARNTKATDGRKAAVESLCKARMRNDSINGETGLAQRGSLDEGIGNVEELSRVRLSISVPARRRVSVE